MDEKQSMPAYLLEIEQMRASLPAQELACAFEQRMAQAAAQAATATPEYAAFANELGALYRSMARFDQGEKAFELALESIEAQEGRSERYAVCLGNLAELYRLEGRLDECERTLAQADRLFSDRSSDEYAACLNYQGHAAMARGRFDAAAGLYEQALAITQANHAGTIDVATAFQNVANAYQQAGRLQQADEHLRRVLAVYDEHGLHVNAHYVGLLNALAASTARQGEMQAAADWLERAVQALDRCRINPLDAAVVLANAASTFARAGRTDAAHRAAQRIRTLVSENSLEGNPQAQRALAVAQSIDRLPEE